MTSADRTDFARQVADLNNYGQALNSAESVEEVVSLTLEAISLLFESAHATFVSVRDGDLRVVHSTNPALSPGDDPEPVARRAYESSETVVLEGEAARISEGSAVETALAVPALLVEEVTAILVMRADSSASFDADSVRPVEILASHAATAVGNIRSRERLERANRELETRTELLELYDRLLRHDLGNDLQVIEGFAAELVSTLDGDAREHATRIRRAAGSSIDLIERVGELVSTIEDQDEPEPVDIADVLDRAVSGARTRYDDLTVRFDPDAVDVRVYGGELLEPVFDNILTNAARHNDGPVTVDVSVETPSAETVVARVSDDGRGIAEEVREDLFEMGRRGPESEGTGFGLGFVRALVESYGGTVTVADDGTDGATFRVELVRV